MDGLTTDKNGRRCCLIPYLDAQPVMSCRNGADSLQLAVDSQVILTFGNDGDVLRLR